MNAKLTICLSLSLAVMANLSTQALAGGDYYPSGGSVKDYAGTPVPAPIPVPLYDPVWYLRVDVGGAWLTNGDINEYGSAATANDLSDNPPTVIGGGGFGRYLTPSIRADLTIDVIGDVALGGDQIYRYGAERSFRGEDVTITDPTGVLPDFTVTSYDTNHYSVKRTDAVKLSQSVGLVNFYYDFKNGTGFTPYLGAGVGVMFRTLNRTTTENAKCRQATNTQLNYPNGLCINTTDLPATYSSENEISKKRWDIAAAAMAGVSYAVTDDILWDNGYRYQFDGGQMTADVKTLNGISTVTVKDTGQHQFRTGLRFNLN